MIMSFLFQQQEELMMRLWSNIKVLILIVHNSYLLPKNKKYKSQIGEERVIYVASSRYDSIDFNYRLMSIFDIMRVTYYKKYHFI